MASNAYCGMNISLTAENLKALDWLLKTGRWANNSEVFRYSLNLAVKEVQRENLAPYTYEQMAKVQTSLSDEEVAAINAMGEQSLKNQRSARSPFE
jgi:Arc/MetJ-type ribon-helix-helix transcriptional regulator